MLLFSGCTGERSTEDDTVLETSYITTESTSVETTEQSSEDEVSAISYKTLQLIPDNSFQTGFTVWSQKDHNNGNLFSELGAFQYDATEGKTPTWTLSSWDSGPTELYNDWIALLDSGAEFSQYIMTDGSYRTVVYDPSNNAISLSLDSSYYYNGRAAAAGDYWPHLLAAQGTFDYFSMDEETKAYYSCSADKLIVSFDMCMPEYSQTANAKDYVEAAQYYIYFYVRGRNSSDFVWFGLQLFDSRSENSGYYMGIDGGKADASGKLIYVIGRSDLLGNSTGSFWKDKKPYPSDEWYHVEIDVVPYLERAFNLGQAYYSYFSVDSLDDLVIDGMNFGFELIGTFDVTISIANLELTSYLSEE